MSRRYVLARVLRLLLGEPGPWPVESVRYAVVMHGDEWRRNWTLLASWRWDGQLYAAARERGFLAVLDCWPLDHPHPQRRAIARELRAAEPQQAQAPEQTVCTYPACNCPFDAPSDPNWCARGLMRATGGEK